MERDGLTNCTNAQDSRNHGISSIAALAQDVDTNGAAYRTLAGNGAKAIGELPGLHWRCSRRIGSITGMRLSDMW